MTYKLVVIIAAIVLIVGIAYAGLFWFLRNPILSVAGMGSEQETDPSTLERHVRFLAAITPPRNGQHLEGLNEAAAYIETSFRDSECEVTLQPFTLHHSEYKNIICSFGPADAPRIVIGAHYDVAGDHNPGADDNASGVAALLELARLLKKRQPSLRHRVDLVAFTLEEPPNFHTEGMGSYVYARHLSENRISVDLMISVEMIGYYSDQPGSQHYPIGLLKLFYPTTGNFIGVVGLATERAAVARVKKLMVPGHRLPVYSINAPRFVPGVTFSDQWSFWQFGYPAVMVTDTAFYRNPNYHQASDTPETLDYERMAQAVEGLYRVAEGY